MGNKQGLKKNRKGMLETLDMWCWRRWKRTKCKDEVSNGDGLRRA